MTWSAVFICCLSLGSCSPGFDLPPRPAAPEGPGSRVPAPGEFAPESGFADQRVVLRGSDLGRTTAEVLVRFGSSSPVIPARVSPEGGELEVVVPDDATDGTITVTTAGGTASTTGAFRFLGRGRLRWGQVVGELDFRAHVQQAVLVSSPAGIALLDGDHAQVAVLGPRGAVDVLPGSGGRVVAIGGFPGSGSLAAVYGPSDASGPCPRPFAGALRLFSGPDWDLQASTASARKTICLAKPVSMPEPLLSTGTVSIATTGDVALVTSPTALWLVDLASEGPAEPLATATKPTWTPGGGAGHGKAFFVAETGGTVLKVDAAFSPPRTDRFLGIPAGHEGSITAFGVKTDTLVVGTDRGEVFLFIAALWPPTNTGVAVPNQSAGAVRSLAPSGYSGSTFGVVLEGDPVAYFYKLQSGTSSFMQPLATQALEDPAGITAPEDGIFYVAVRGGVALLSQKTGLFLTKQRLLASPRSPRLVTLGAAGDEPVRALAVALGRLDAISFFDPATFGPCADPRCQSLALASARSIDQIDAGPEGRELFVLRSSTVSRVALPERAEDPESTWRPVGAVPSQARLSMAADGSAALLRYEVTYDRTGFRLAALPVGKPWSQTRVLDLGQGERAFAVTDAGGRLAQVGPDALRLFDLAALLEGEPEVLAESPLAQAPAWAGSAAGRVFVVDEPAKGSARLASASFAEGKLGEARPLPASSSVVVGEGTLALSPSGRRLWAVGGMAGSLHLRTFLLDPADGSLAGEEPPIRLPGGADSLYVFPDGETIVVVDGDRDALVVVR